MDDYIESLRGGDYLFILTREQQETICKHFGKNVDELQDFEIGELLDKVIDNLV